MEPELEPIELPGQFLPVLRLSCARRGEGGGRDGRIGRLVLGYLEPARRDFLLSCPGHQTRESILALGYRSVKAYCSQLVMCHHALWIVAWKLGLIDHSGRRRRAFRLPLVVELMERHLGANPDQTEFACLACGHLIHVPVEKTKKVTCPTCQTKFGLRFNDGKRIAFSRQRTPRNSWVSVDSNPRFDPYEILRVAPTATYDEMRKAYHQQLRQCHPDKVYGLGSPTARWAAEEATRNLNAAWQQIRQSAAA